MHTSSIIFSFTLLTVTYAGQLPTEPDLPHCGPRCVHFILKQQFSIPVELTQVLEELLPDDSDSGVSLLEMASYLNHHGIKTKAVRIRESDVLLWHSPAILHVKKAEESLSGHFVVYLPANDQHPSTIWDPKTRLIEEANWENLWQHMSGNVLLTSRKSEIELDSLTFSPQRRLFAMVLTCLSILIVILTTAHYLVRSSQNKRATWW